MMQLNFSTFFDSSQLDGYLGGVMNYEYDGVLCHKSPIDMAIYLRLLSDRRPRSIIEIGSMFGGSALLLRDFAAMLHLDCELVSIDLDPPNLGSKAHGIRFIAGDAHDLNVVFAAYSLDKLARPWLLIEDSAHTFSACTAVLQFCAKHLLPGEFLVMEDGVLDELGLKEKYDGGPNRAVGDFLSDSPGVFVVDRFYCDMFGRNATFNPNGYLRRV